jgi:hypothetical protein
VQTLYEVMKNDPETKGFFIREKEQNTHIYHLSEEYRFKNEDFIKQIYDDMTQFQKMKRLKKAGIKLPPEKPKIVQPKKIETSPAPKQEKVVSVPQDININVRVTFEGFISFLFGIDRNGPIG